MEVTQRRRKVAFDKRQKTRKLLPDMWIMLQDARKLEFSAKFDALWMGPYIIKEVFPNKSVQLKTLDGVDFPTRTNGSHCKEYKVWTRSQYMYLPLLILKLEFNYDLATKLSILLLTIFQTWAQRSWWLSSHNHD